MMCALVPMRACACMDVAAYPYVCTTSQVTERVVDVVKAFEKVDSAKVSDSSDFQKDLGLDSLDAVEVSSFLFCECLGKMVSVVSLSTMHVLVACGLCATQRFFLDPFMFVCMQLVMAFEDEFALEIPDIEADKILTCADAVAYISSHPNAK